MKSRKDNQDGRNIGEKNKKIKKVFLKDRKMKKTID